MNSRAYQHSSQQPHPHQQSHQPHQAHAGHTVAPYAAALQGQVNPHSRPVFQQPGSQNAAPQAGAAGSGPPAAGPGSAGGQMMHQSGGQMVPNQANQPPQSYQNAPPQQAIRSAFGPPQQVPQNRPQMQMHQQSQQQQQAQNAAAAAAAMPPVLMFPNYNQHHVVQHMYQANAGQPQPILSIPSSSIQAINVSHAADQFVVVVSDSDPDIRPHVTDCMLC